MKLRASVFIFPAIALLVAMTPARAIDLSDEDMENLVKRSFQYVAMYNVNNKFAPKQGGWNRGDADTELKDHTMR